jgi:hypothetical protein
LIECRQDRGFTIIAQGVECKPHTIIENNSMFFQKIAFPAQHPLPVYFGFDSFAGNHSEAIRSCRFAFPVEPIFYDGFSERMFGTQFSGCRES